MQTPYETYLPWFILREIPSIGNALYKRLIDQFGSPQAVFSASKSQIETVPHISKKAVKGILYYGDYVKPAQEELNLLSNYKIGILTLSDPLYPVLLKQIGDPPPILTFLGNPDNQAPCFAVVGSRNATRYGLSTAENLSARLAQKGFQVVSGLARGIDTKAHSGALSAGKKTIAVLGSGLNKVYPKENTALFQSIAETGTVYSEFKFNDAPLPRNFPVRNRIIAGVSCGTLVVEAAKRSGSLITARLAGEYNREIFAIPGSISSIKSQGTHSLLKQGAKLVEDEMDIIDELGHFIHEEIPDPQKPRKIKTRVETKNKTCQTPANHIIDFLEPYPVHIDSLIEKSHLDSAAVSSQLLNLELSGQVIRHQGNYYSIAEDIIE